MPLDISSQPIRVLIDGHDTEGRLILADDHVAAVIVRLDGAAHSAEGVAISSDDEVVDPV